MKGKKRSIPEDIRFWSRWGHVRPKNFKTNIFAMEFDVLRSKDYPKSGILYQALKYSSEVLK